MIDEIETVGDMGRGPLRKEVYVITSVPVAPCEKLDRTRPRHLEANGRAGVPLYRFYPRPGPNGGRPLSHRLAADTHRGNHSSRNTAPIDTTDGFAFARV
jgi:hypothetical protein